MKHEQTYISTRSRFSCLNYKWRKTLFLKNCKIWGLTVLQISFSVYRSACYFALKHYQDCLTDIDLALEAGYPTHMVYKLYIRQCKCLLELCRIPQAQEAFDKAIDAIDRSGMKKELRKVKSASGCSFLLNWTKLAEFDLDAILRSL